MQRLPRPEEVPTIVATVMLVSGYLLFERPRYQNRKASAGGEGGAPSRALRVKGGGRWSSPDQIGTSGSRRALRIQFSPIGLRMMWRTPSLRRRRCILTGQASCSGAGVNE